MGRRKPRVLFLDAYDSFSHNIISLLETTLDVDVTTRKIDDSKIDSIDKLKAEIKGYDAVVCGPGPGHPMNDFDVGAIENVWKLDDEDIVPVLGICLGFQSLCLEFGADVKRLKGPQHGIIRKVNHIGESIRKGKASIFQSVGDVYATLYQSLGADIGQHDIPKNLWESKKWEPTKKCPDLLPLAWVESELADVDYSGSGIADDRVFVGVRHRVKPFWALQYHPESICTNTESIGVISNWFVEVQTWNELHGRRIGGIWSPVPKDTKMSLLEQYRVGQTQPIGHTGFSQLHTPGTMHICYTNRLPIPPGIEAPDIIELLQDMWHDHVLLESSNACSQAHPDVKGRYSIIGLNASTSMRFEYRVGDEMGQAIRYDAPGDQPSVHNIAVHQPGGIWTALAGIVECYRDVQGYPESPFWGGLIGFTTYELGLEGINVGLKSRPQGNHINRETSQRPDACFVMITDSIVVDHDMGMLYFQKLGPRSASEQMKEETLSMARKVFMSIQTKHISKELFAFTSVIFSNIPKIVEEFDFLDRLKATGFPHPDTCEYVYPHGKFAGTAYATYGYSKNLADSVNKQLDLSQALNDIDFTIHGQKVDISFSPHGINPRKDGQKNQVKGTQHTIPSRMISFPSNEEYESKVRECQEYIRSGDSYELCLTDQSTVECQQHSGDRNAWQLYKKLRQAQPAPFASYLSIGSATLVSASPERFLKWDEKGMCELRPMKGTIRKTPSTTFAKAKALLDVPKERAENLMIVDLVRHDLHGICGSGNVTVPKLMVVEEYESVYQMISIVQGHIPPPPCVKQAAPLNKLDFSLARVNAYEQGQESRHFTGIDVLAASLPPGSMTGAPKKRSCEILQEIEKGKERSLYSGVVGYMDVGGRGDFSVTIRCMFKWDDEDREDTDEYGITRKFERWHVGAGGAVTTLSTPEGEREEMFTKARGTLGIF